MSISEPSKKSASSNVRSLFERRPSALSWENVARRITAEKHSKPFKLTSVVVVRRWYPEACRSQELPVSIPGSRICGAYTTQKLKRKKGRPLDAKERETEFSQIEEDG